jgi:hypothetical protein
VEPAFVKVLVRRWTQKHTRKYYLYLGPVRMPGEACRDLSWRGEDIGADFRGFVGRVCRGLSWRTEDIEIDSVGDVKRNL